MMRHKTQLVTEHGIQILGIVVKRVILKIIHTLYPIEKPTSHPVICFHNKCSSFVFYPETITGHVLKSVCSSIMSNFAELVTAVPNSYTIL